MKEKLRTLHHGQAAIIAVCFALFFTVLVPIQTFLANSDLFLFPINEVIFAALPVFAALALGTFAVLLLSELVAGRVLHVLALAVLLCGYLEISVLSIGLPALNAAPVVFANPFRKMIDTGALGLAVAMLLLAYRWLKNCSHWVSLAIVIMITSSFFDVARKTVSTGEGGLVAGQCPNYDALLSARFSPTRNVLVFILDSTPASITSRLMRDNSDLQERFRGFTAFENNRAMHEMTFRGLPGLMTGLYLEKDTAADDYMGSVFGKDSLLMPYVEKDFPIYFTDAMLPYGYTNRRIGTFSKEGEDLVQCGPVFHRNSKDTPYITLFDTVRFRLAPYALKRRIFARARNKAMRHHVPNNFADDLSPLRRSLPLRCRLMRKRRWECSIRTARMAP